MIVRMGLFRRKNGIDQDEFLNSWRAGHGPVARGALAEMHAYVQNAVTERAQRSIDYPRLDVEVDGMSQLYFRDLGALRRSAGPSAIEVLAEDEARFMEDLVVLTALQNTVITPPADGTAVKRMSLLRKRDDVSTEQFQDQWFNVHSALVKRIPGLLGYRQNLVIEARRDRFDDSDNEDVGIDGIVELWFETPEKIDAGFQSPAGLTTMAHAREFLGAISTYMVAPYDVFQARQI